MGFEEVKGATLSAPLEAMSDMFMIAGDIHASLYSGSKAMHSHILHIFSEVRYVFFIRPSFRRQLVAPLQGLCGNRI
jgi:hypothetical protein